CGTCHNPHDYEQSTDPDTGTTADNLKLIRNTISPDRVPGVQNPVVFQSPAHFAFDTEPYVGICQACHTQTNHHTNDDAADHAHQTGSDCTACHAHDDGLGLSGAACDACHGNPPTLSTPGGPNGMVDYPAPTGSLSAGAHSIHAGVSGYRFGCDTCHYGGMPDSAVSDNNLVQIGFDIFGRDASGTGYDGQSLDAPYDYEATNNTAVGTGATLTCTNIYCHGALADGTVWGAGGSTAPQWDGTASCGDCHAATSAAPPQSGSHAVHAGDTGLDLVCETCHAGYPATHVNNSANVSFAADPLLAGASYSGTPAMLDAYGDCSSLYCHSSVQNSTGTAGPASFATASWGGPSLDCDSCHGNPPSTGNHLSHLDNTGHGSTITFECTTCHALDSHGNYSIDVLGSQGYTHGGTPGNGFGMCATACHTGAIWGGTTLYCIDCHGSNEGEPPPPGQTAPTVVPEPSIISATPATVTLEWSAVAPSMGWQTQYYVEVSVNADYSSPVHTSGWITATSRTVTLDTSHTWFWRVRARDAARPGIISSWATNSFSITIDNTPLAPVLTAEPNYNSAGAAATVTLQWSAVACPDSDPTEYYVEVDQVSNFTSPDFASGYISGTSWSFQALPEKTYYWRVKARDAVHTAYESGWSYTDSFFDTYIASGSCPFLFVWDGQSFKFQTDLYGPGKLAAKSSRGYFTPNPNDYYVLATTPAEAGGQYRMRLVEERFETDYLDELKLFVMDVPPDRLVYADKPGFGETFGGFQGVLHTVARNLPAPLSVTHINTGA
ncbi:CxxxxCH/CxxCH domain-containing protein, partial [Thermodesulfobacteriota bacterium]